MSFLAKRVAKERFTASKKAELVTNVSSAWARNDSF